MRKRLLAAAAMTLAAMAFTACGGASGATGGSTAGSSAAAEGATVYKVGIIQFMEHPSLNQIEKNLEKQLDAVSTEAVVYDYKPYTFNGQGDATTLNQIAAQLIDDKVDVIVPIATPAAQIVQSATEGKDIPVVFSAVSDPVSAKLVASMEKPGANITGTSDYLDTDAIMELILAANPETDYVGLLYSKSEDSSLVPIADAKRFLDAKGIRYIEKTGTTTDEVSAAVDALIAEQVDAVFTPTDNTIQNAELAFYDKLAEAKIPHYAGADSFALNGAFCGYGVDYAQLGVATADMIAEILDGGRAPAELAVQTFDNGIATINTDTCAQLGMDLETVKSAFQPLCTQIIETVTQKDFWRAPHGARSGAEAARECGVR